MLEREIAMYKQRLTSEEERRGRMVDAYETQVHVYIYMQSVMGLNPTQGSFFFEKRKSCPGCISLPLLACHVYT